MLMTQGAPLLFGAGSLSQLGNRIQQLGSKKAIIITDKGVSAAGVTDKVAAVIKEAGADLAIFDECLGDAPDTVVQQAAKKARDEKVDLVIGLGGGSSMDTAKAASIIIKNEKPISDFIMKPPSPPDAPVILIPTTSGTGSEMTLVGVISDSKTFKKYGVLFTGALVSIVDPELTVGVPPHITAATGMDVVAHCVEAITGKQRNPLSDLRGYEALRLVAAYLPLAVADGSNLEARSAMSFASSLAGMAFSDSITTFGHAVAQALASTLHLHHGLLCGLATPPQLECFATAVPARVRKIGEIMGAVIPLDATPEQIGKFTADRVRLLMSQIGIKSFEQQGYSREDIVSQIDNVMEERMKDFSPCEINRDVALKALNSMYDYKGC